MAFSQCPAWCIITWLLTFPSHTSNPEQVERMAVPTEDCYPWHTRLTDSSNTTSDPTALWGLNGRVLGEIFWICRADPWDRNLTGALGSLGSVGGWGLEWMEMCAYVSVGPCCLLSVERCINHKGSGCHGSHYGIPLKSRPGPDYPSQRENVCSEERPFARSPPEKTNSALIALTSQRKATHWEKLIMARCTQASEFSLFSESSITLCFKIFMRSDSPIHTARKSNSVEKSLNLYFCRSLLSTPNAWESLANNHLDC